jgi:hypothetical protein
VFRWVDGQTGSLAELATNVQTNAAVKFKLVNAGGECGESATLIIFRSSDPCFALHNGGSLDQASTSAGAEVYCSSLCNFPGGPLMIGSAARFIFGFRSVRHKGRPLALGSKLPRILDPANAVTWRACGRACFAQETCCFFASGRHRPALRRFVQLDELASGVLGGFDRAPQALEADP